MADDSVRKPDFSGYATKYNIKCVDGRTIKPNAFKHMDGTKVPLVWQHGHNDINNVLGHVILHAREDGIFSEGYFNDTPGGQAAKIAVQHGDIEALSIFANELVQKNQMVHDGVIRETSLVLSGANSGAFIESVYIAHGDGESYPVENEAIISTMTALDVYNEETLAHEDKPNKTVKDVINAMDDDEKKVLYSLVADAMSGTNDSMQQSNNDKGETFMKNNVFSDSTDEKDGNTLTHTQRKEFATAVFDDLSKYGSFKASFLAHAGTYGIDNISYLFPDAKLDENEPSFETRRMEWVKSWMSGTRKSPFSRIKKVWADLTPAAARAKGYITGNQKVEQVFALLKRVTAPTTVYKKQKLDRDDVVDIVDFDVVSWMWKEMRFMLEEEVARAGLVGDGRVFGTDDDAVNPNCIRPIYGDDPLFVHYLSLPVTETDYLDIIDSITEARVNYKGSGMPTLYTTNAVLTGMLLVRDTTGRRIYRTVQELAAELRVADIVEVEVMEGLQRDNASPAFTADLLGIMVNPRDYTYGADKGGQISTFEDFDIDYNQMKYLIETRMSGSLLNPKSAMVIERKTA